MNGASNIVDLQSVFHRHGHFIDGFTGTFGNNSDCENRAVALCDYLDESTSVIVTDGSIHSAQIPPADRYFLTKFGSSLFLRRADLRNLGIGKGNPRNEVGQSRTASRQKGVADSLKRLPSRKMGELVTANDIARRVNLPGRGP